MYLYLTLFCNIPRDSPSLTVPAVLVLHESLSHLLFSADIGYFCDLVL
jgi:hypothetical protein